MAENGSIKLFGFEIKRSKSSESEEKQKKSIVPPVDMDGAGYVTASGTHFGQYVDIDGDRTKDNFQLIQKYRGMALHPEIDAAIEDIVDEAMSTDDTGFAVSINLDEVDVSDKIKEQITEEFNNILHMLKFNELGHDIFRRWYVDGRIVFHIVINESSPGKGILEIRPIDSAKIRKVKEIKKKKDPVTGAQLIEKVDEYYVYQEKPGSQTQGVKMTSDSILYVTSGLLNESQKNIISYLHKALKPLNQLRMMEDSLVIYRLARAPERRIFYIDVGNLPKGKAEEYMKGIMTRYRNKLVYDASTGDIRDDRKHMSMLEDFWLPRREGGRGTEITTLPGGENLGQIDDIVYFQKRLYRALNVPINRLEQEAQFSLGRSSEITRDELKFQKFIDRLRKRFSHMFYGALKTQLILKNIITEDDWNEWIRNVHFEYVVDNHFTEMKNAEVLRERLQTMDMAQNYVGEYISKEWVMKNVLQLTDEEIKDMQDQMKSEVDSGEVEDPRDDGQNDSQNDQDQEPPRQ